MPRNDSNMLGRNTTTPPTGGMGKGGADAVQTRNSNRNGSNNGGKINNPNRSGGSSSNKGAGSGKSQGSASRGNGAGR